MKSLLKRVLVGIVAIGLIAGLIFAFIAGHQEAGREAEGEAPIKAPNRIAVVNGETVVTLDQAARTSGGVTLAPLEAITHRHVISAYGTVLDLQELTDLENAIETARAQLSKARATRQVAREEYDRAKALYEKNQNVSRKVVQAAKGTLRVQEANGQMAQAALRAAQATALQHWGRVIADWLGKAAPELGQLQSQKSLLVQVTLAPGQGNVAAPPTASVQTTEGKPVPATFVSLAPRIDPLIQGKRFFYIVAAEGTNLLPGMNVIVLLPAGKSARGSVVPAPAVVWLQGKPWAYMQLKPNRFVRREVSTEQPVPGGWFQTQGFSTGQVIVIKGPQVLLSEEFRAQIQIHD